MDDSWFDYNDKLVSMNKFDSLMENVKSLETTLNTVSDYYYSDVDVDLSYYKDIDGINQKGGNIYYGKSITIQIMCQK